MTTNYSVSDKIIRVLNSNNGEFTVDELSAIIFKPKPLVSKALKYAEYQGCAKRVGSVKSSGRQAVIWSASER